MMERYERAIRTNMASAERDMNKYEDRRGFVIGAVLQLWETYHDKKQINERLRALRMTRVSVAHRAEIAGGADAILRIGRD